MPENIIANPGGSSDSIQVPEIQNPTPYQSSVDRLNNVSLQDRVLNEIGYGNRIQDKLGEYTLSDVPHSSRYPQYYLDRDNEEMYAQHQSGLDKIKNGVAKFAGTTFTSFVDGTAGLVNGIFTAVSEGRWSGLWDNATTRKMDELSQKWEDDFAHYRTIREREGNWWEPSNLFTGNMFWDGIVKNLGFSLGAYASGFGIASALKAIGLTSKLVGLGEQWSEKALQAINEGASMGKTSRMATTLSKLENVYNEAKYSLGTGLKTHGDQAITALMGSASEAGIEALQNSQQFRQQMISDFKKNHGYDPNPEEISKINESAEKVGNWSWGLNVALLTGTNYIQLPKIFASSFKAEKSELNNIAFNAEKGLWENSLPTSKFGKLLYKTANIASLGFNTAEAFEEGAQYAIQTGTQNYFSKKFDGKNVSFLNDGLSEGVYQALTTDDGLLNIFTGGVSGALQSSGFVGIKKGEDGKWKPGIGITGKIGERGLTGYGGEQAKIREEAISAFNNSLLKNKLKDGFDNLARAEYAQETRQRAIKLGDILESKDAEYDFIHSFLASRVKYAGMEAINPELQSIREKASTDEGFLELQQSGYAPSTDTKESFLNRLRNFETHARNFVDLNDKINLKYKGVLDKEGNRVYDDLSLDKLVYAGSKIKDYESRINDLYKDLGKYTGKTLPEALQEIHSDNTITDTEKEETIQKLSDFNELHLRRNQFISEYNDILQNPQSYKESEKETLQSNKTISVKTKTGDKELVVGEKYMLGRVIEKSKEGNEVYRFPELTILGENEDGTIKIQASNGNVRDISKDELEDYKLAKSSDVANNKTATFFKNHANDVYQYNFGKGEKRRGRLEFEEGKLYFTYKDSNGNTQRKQIDNSHFQPQEGYRDARLKKIGTLTAETESQRSSREAFLAEQVDRTKQSFIDEQSKQRLQIIKDLYESHKNRLEEVEKKIFDKTESLKSVSEKINALKEQAGGEKQVNFKQTFSRIVKTTMSSINSLSRTQASLEQELASLNNEKEELEFNVSYLEDMQQNLKELPQNFYEFLDELEKQTKSLKDAIIETGKNINSVSNILDRVKEAIKDLFQLLKSSFQKFDNNYPDYIKNTFDSLLKSDNFSDLPTLKEYVADYAFTEDTKKEIAINQENVKELSDKIDSLYKDLNNLEKEYKIKNQIYERFKDVFDSFVKEEKRLNDLKESEVYRDMLFKRNEKGNENNTHEKRIYEEAKKDDKTFYASTTVPSEKSENSNFEAKKADIEIGKVGNTEYEVKADGVYYQDKKLDNPENKSYKQLIEADIERRMQEELNKRIPKEEKLYKDDEGREFVITYTNDGRLKLSVPVEGGTQNIGEYSAEVAIENIINNPQLVGNYTRKNKEEFINKINAKYDAELAALNNFNFLPHHIRANYFGLVLPTLSDRESYKGVVISSNMGENFSPIIDLSADGYKATSEDDEIMLLVAVKETKDGLQYVNEKGEPVGKFGQKIDPNLLVFQKLPAIYSNESRTRASSTEESVKNYQDQYKKQRTEWLSNPSLNGRVMDITPSFGFVKDEYKTDEPQPVTNLVSKDDIRNKALVVVSTTENESLTNGIQTLKAPKGTVWLQTDTTIQPLNNRKLTEKEQSTIFSAIKALAKLYETGEIKNSEKANKIFDFLRGIVYWGIPINEAGRSSLWFTKDGYLHFANNEQRIPFSLQAISQNEKLIKTFLSNIYNNTNKQYLNSSEPFYEITSISEDGNIESKKWDSYQEYLLSPEGRSNSEIPLSISSPKPILEDGTQTRKGVYFVMNTLRDEYTSPEVELSIPEQKEEKQVVKQPLKLDTIASVPFADIVKEIVQEKQTEQKVLPKEDTSVARMIIEMSSKSEAEKQAALAKLESNFGSTTAAVSDAIQQDLTERKPIGIAAALAEEFKPIDRNSQLRIVNGNAVREENWNKIESWMKKNLPNVPVFRVKNLLEVGENTFAWGAYADGAIYLYEFAEEGTYYHEVFHLVMDKFASSQEKEKIFKEFKNRKGSFVERVSGKNINYKDASFKQMEEKLAEEFREYILSNEKQAPRNFVQKFFSDLFNFVKGLFLNRNNITDLFKDINGGKYRYYVSGLENSAYAQQGIMNVNYISSNDFSTFEARPVINAVEEKDILDHLTSQSFNILFTNKDDLLNIKSVNKTAFYDSVYKSTISTLISSPFNELQNSLKEGKISQESFNNQVSQLEDLAGKIINNWSDIQAKHELYMKTFSIEFDENDELVNTDENKTGRETGQDAMKVDHIRKATSAIKMLFATLKETVFDTYSYDDVLSSTKVRNSSINGDVLVSFGKAFVQTLNSLANSKDFNKLTENLVSLAKNNPNYVKLFERIGGNRVNGKINWDSFKTDDISLLIQFFKTFSKQSPEVLNHYISEDGSSYIGSGNLANATEELAERYEQSFIKTVKNSGLFTKINTKDFKGWKGNVAELKKLSLRSDDNKIAFLKALGIDIEFKKLNAENKAIVRKAIDNIHTALIKSKGVVSISGSTFDMAGNLSDIAETQARLANNGYESTFFNIDGEMQQTFVEKNYASKFAENINDINHIDEISSNFSYLKTDPFSKNSLLINKLFNENGERVGKVRIGYINGTVDGIKNRRITTDKLNQGMRMLQQLNLNVNGWYYTLLPADSSTEWMINTGNFISLTDLRNNNREEIYNAFKGYLESEILTAQEDRQHANYVIPRRKELRFFKDILPESLAKEAVKSTNFEEFYKANKESIDNSVDKFIKNIADTYLDQLKRYGYIVENSQGSFSFKALDTKNLGKIDTNNISEETLNHLMDFLAANYSIANIEMHKTIFGDPYEYKDEVKRIKSFLSPAETTINSSPELNLKLNEVYNEGLVSTDPGFRNFKEYVNTISFSDVEVISDGYEDPYVEPDAQGLITDVADREFKIKTDLWNPLYEEQYQYDKAWERNYKAEKGLYTYSSESLKKSDEKILKKGNPGHKKDFITKPIVRGNKYNSPINSVMIDKFSLAPISFRSMIEFAPNSNMVDLYDKMIAENIDYAVFESARKVGNEGNNNPYGEDGKINKDPFRKIVKVPFENFSIQVQTTPKEEPKQTLGSQLTKLATLNLMSGGTPIDYKGNDWKTLSEEQKQKESPLYKKVKHNQSVLQGMIEEGYNQMLKKLGLSDNGNTFIVKDRNKLTKTLQEEILRREVNENILKSLDYFAQGKIALESTPVYQTFKNILYSIVDKNISSLKVTGGPKVQMASTFFEEKREIKKTVKGKAIYGSTDLKFYENEDGKRHIEVYISSDFIRKQLDEKHPLQKVSDDELFSLTEKGVLEGIGFRIPTQNTNSSDVFVIKKFLPREMGDAVVVPSALVKKVGSDFDIDKLNTYLKNIYVSPKGEIKEIPFFGFGEEAKKEIGRWLAENQFKSSDFKAKESALDDLDIDDAIEKDMNDVDKVYKKSLQNEYYRSLQNLLSDPLNFERLVEPNDATPLKSIAKKIAELRSLPNENGPISNLLSPVFMSRMRHNFVIGKYAVGIAAVQQTNQSLNQRTEVYIDPERIKTMDESDKFWIKDGKINLPTNKTEINGKEYVSLSGILSQDGKYISDLLSMFIDGYVDVAKGAWIIDLGATPNVASTFMFLIKAGVPAETVAYFMNQPIIVDYLQELDKRGYSWLFIDSVVDYLKSDKYNSSVEGISSINIKSLEENIGKEISDPAKKAEQRFILDEFLKYAKLASGLFEVTQGTNYDTSNFNDPYLLFKKSVQLQKALKSVIVGAEDILNNSFISTTKNLLENARNAVASFLPTDSPRIRNIIENSLSRFTDLPDRQFIKTSKQVVQSFLDYTLQTYYNVNKNIDVLMVGDRNVPQQVQNIIDSLPKGSDIAQNPVIQSLVHLASQKEGKVNNLKLTGKSSEAYQQNNIIKSFQEIKESPYFKEIYPQIIRVSLLQGLANSPISFTQFIPVEDLVQALQPIVSQLENIPELENFSSNYMFERNNWNNNDIVPFQKQWKKNDYGVLKIFSKIPQGILKDIRAKGSEIIALDSLSKLTDSDVISVSYNKPGFSSQQIEEMKKAGDYSYLYKGLFQAVKDNKGDILGSSYTIKDKQGNIQRTGKTLYFKQINAWGDSFRLQEYYQNPQQSVVDNGFVKINELSDEYIVSLFRPNQSKNDFPDKKLNLSC